MINEKIGKNERKIREQENIIQNNTQKLLDPRKDVVFQALLGTDGSEMILGALLENILGRKIEDVEFNENQNLIRKISTDKLRNIRFGCNHRQKRNSQYRNADI